MSLCPNKAEDPSSEVNLRKILCLLLTFCSNKKVPEITEIYAMCPDKESDPIIRCKFNEFFSI